MHMDYHLLDLWERYGDLLWEPGKHKEACRAYIDEMHRFMIINNQRAFDNELLDALTIKFRKKGNRNSTINRKFASLSKLLRKHQKKGFLVNLPDFQKLPERNGRIRFLTQEEEADLLSELEMEDRKYAQLSRFLAETGARIGEALKLNLGRHRAWTYDLLGNQVSSSKNHSTQPQGSVCRQRGEGSGARALRSVSGHSLSKISRRLEFGQEPDHDAQ